MLTKDWKYIMAHWKLVIHLLLRTKRFGVNNQRKSTFDSMFGLTRWSILWRIIRVFPIVREYKLIRYRAVELSFLTPRQCERMGWMTPQQVEFWKEVYKAHGRDWEVGS